MLYCFMTDLKDPMKVISTPGGCFMAPIGSERLGDVSNVVFSNGAIEKDGEIFILCIVGYEVARCNNNC